MVCCSVCSLKGAREEQQDRSHAVQVNANVYWVGVHDGHSGQDAVEHLVEWVRRDKRQPGEEGHAGEDVYMLFLADTYYMLQNHLQDERSGTVSISALCVPDAVYLGWVGDCVGCVFDSATHTIYSHGTMTDFAEAETTQCDSAQSVPHCSVPGNGWRRPNPAPVAG
jgi:serine/threonine protein phosphatase PrpC